jgi:hypothetical protein
MKSTGIGKAALIDASGILQQRSNQ